ncbi:MAG: MBL fold metallo-hydrolase [Eubacterium sp.]|nr:MBL fold metallo-hydrolase [Eubacterium sp.]
MADTGEVVVKMMVVGPVQTNCYIIRREGSDKCVVVDPGAEGDRIFMYIKTEEMKCEGILLTHGHFDHFEGVDELVGYTGAEVYILDEEAGLIADSRQNGSLGLMGKGSHLEVKNLLHDGETIELADISFKVIHTPGHTAGGCCYYIESAGLLFAGDTIFMESIGRTDLPTGSMKEIISSIREKILSLPGDVKILPGHGPVTDVAYETANNPYA